MNLLAYILAAKKELGWVEIVVVALFFGVSIIGSIIQKTKEKKQKDNASKPSGESRGRRPEPTVIPQARRTRQPVPVAPQPVRVSQELRQRQQRQSQLEADRQKRLATRRSPESDTNAIESRLVSVHPEETVTEPGEIGEIDAIVELKTPADAKRAIILHEIFSPPKALRTGGEMWDE
jgi:hypothetical protein